MDKNFNLNFGNGYILKPKIIRYLEGFEVKFKFINKKLRNKEIINASADAEAKDSCIFSNKFTV